MKTCKRLSPPPHDAQAQTLAGLLVELHGERVPEVLLLVLRLVPVDHQADSLWGLPQHIDGFIVTGFPQVDTVHLQRQEGKEVGSCLLQLPIVTTFCFNLMLKLNFPSAPFSCWETETLDPNMKITEWC